MSNNDVIVRPQGHFDKQDHKFSSASFASSCGLGTALEHLEILNLKESETVPATEDVVTCDTSLQTPKEYSVYQMIEGVPMPAVSQKPTPNPVLNKVPDLLPADLPETCPKVAANKADGDALKGIASSQDSNDMSSVYSALASVFGPEGDSIGREWAAVDMHGRKYRTREESRAQMDTMTLQELFEEQRVLMDRAKKCRENNRKVLEAFRLCSISENA